MLLCGVAESCFVAGTLARSADYTLAVGKPNADMRIDQEKHCAVCFSADGYTWVDHQIVMSPRPDVPREDAAVAAPYVWREDNIAAGG